MLRLAGQNLIQNLRRFLLIGVGLVRWLCSSQQGERIKDGGLMIFWVTEVKLLHCLLISEGASSMVDRFRLFIKGLDGGDVVPLPLRSGPNHVCLLHGSHAVP